MYLLFRGPSDACHAGRLTDISCGDQGAHVSPDVKVMANIHSPVVLVDVKVRSPEPLNSRLPYVLCIREARM